MLKMPGDAPCSVFDMSWQRICIGRRMGWTLLGLRSPSLGLNDHAAGRVAEMSPAMPQMKLVIQVRFVSVMRVRPCRGLHGSPGEHPIR